MCGGVGGHKLCVSKRECLLVYYCTEHKENNHLALFMKEPYSHDKNRDYIIFAVDISVLIIEAFTKVFQIILTLFYPFKKSKLKKMTRLI